MQDILDLIVSLQNNPEHTWEKTKSYFETKGFEGLASGIIEKSTASIAGIHVDMSSNWMEHYQQQNYMAVDPWAEKSITTDQPFIYNFENRATCFPDHDHRVSELFEDLKESQYTSSLLLPAFHLEDHLLVLNLWCRNTEDEFLSEMQHSLKELKIAGDVIRTHLKDVAIHGVYNDADTFWLKNPNFANPLSRREKEVLQWLSSGLRNDQIAYRMNISVATVNFHMQSVRRKLGAKTREQALAISIVRRFIEP